MKGATFHYHIVFADLVILRKAGTVFYPEMVLQSLSRFPNPQKKCFFKSLLTGSMFSKM